MKRHGLLSPGVLFTLALLVVILTGPWLAPHDPLAVDLGHALARPSAGHLLGTDQLGRDVFSRVLAGGQVTVGVAMAALVVSMLVGIPIGMISGLRGGGLDWALLRTGDVFMSFPEYVVAIVITALLGPGFVNLFIAVAVVKWVGYARLARSVVVEEKSREYVLAARVSGASSWRLLGRHMLPHVAGPVLALATLDLGKIILLVASLSFLGFGVPPPAPEWGSMLNEGRTYFTQTSMLMFAPGLAILAVVLATNIVGDRLADRLGGRHMSTGEPAEVTDDTAVRA